MRIWAAIAGCVANFVSGCALFIDDTNKRSHEAVVAKVALILYEFDVQHDEHSVKNKEYYLTEARKRVGLKDELKED